MIINEKNIPTVKKYIKEYLSKFSFLGEFRNGFCKLRSKFKLNLDLSESFITEFKKPNSPICNRFRKEKIR
jgi:hypothetical protein